MFWYANQLYITNNIMQLTYESRKASKTHYKISEQQNEFMRWSIIDKRLLTRYIRRITLFHTCYASFNFDELAINAITWKLCIFVSKIKLHDLFFYIINHWYQNHSYEFSFYIRLNVQPIQYLTYSYQNFQKIIWNRVVSNMMQTLGVYCCQRNNQGLWFCITLDQNHLYSHSVVLLQRNLVDALSYTIRVITSYDISSWV